MMSSRNRLLLQIERSFPQWARAIKEAQLLDNTFCRQENISNEGVTWFLLWILIPVTSLMDLCMSLKLEMELVAENELDYFYWYWDYLCSTRVYAFNTIRELKYALERNIYMANIEAAEKTMHKVAAMKKMKRKKEAAARDAADEAEAKLILEKPAPEPMKCLPEEMLTRAKSQLCRGIMRLFLVASNLKSSALAKTEFPFGPSWPYRFMQRFRSFYDIPYPHPLTYEKFLEILETKIGVKFDARDMLTQAGMFFKKSKSMIEETKKYHSIVNESPPNIFDELGPHDVVPVRTCTELLKVGIVGALNVHRLEEQIDKLLPASPKTEVGTEDDVSAGSAPTPAAVGNSHITVTALKCNFSYHKHFAIPEMTLTFGV